MRKKRVVVLYGGKADEHSISCVSAAGVLNAIDTERFAPVPIGITRSGDWVMGGADPRSFSLTGTADGAVASGAGENAEASAMPQVDAEGARPVVLNMAQGNNGFYVREEDGSLTSLGYIDEVFPVLHGPFGEDGTVQGLLEMMGVPYVGCGVFASAAAMDKHYTKVLLREAGIPVVPGITVDTRAFDNEDGFADDAATVMESVRKAKLSYPLFVKPSRAGSSFGVTRVERKGDVAELAAALQEASRHDWKVLVEQGVDAREIECPILAPSAGSEPQASMPGEIVLDRKADGADQFYDFDSKYTDAEASHVQVPADLPQDTLSRVQEVAVKAFKAIDGTGLSRVDTFVTPRGEVLVNEINTMPGFTPISMYSKAWEASGMSYRELITALLDGAVK